MSDEERADLSYLEGQNRQHLHLLWDSFLFEVKIIPSKSHLKSDPILKPTERVIAKRIHKISGFELATLGHVLQ